MQPFYLNSSWVRIAKCAILLVSIVSFFAPSVHTIITDQQIRHERAQAAVFDAANFSANLPAWIAALGSLAYDAAAAVVRFAVKYKEFVLDPIVWYGTKILIRQIVRDLVDWINSGFQGAPGFITDFQGFVLNAADRALGDFIQGTDLAFMCDPFSAQIRLALIFKFGASFDDEIGCTFSDVLANGKRAFDQFAEGDFLAGGWDGWFKMTQVPGNNPYGAFMMSQIEAEERAGRAQFRAKWEVDLGGGILSWTTCPAGSDRSPDGGCYNELSGEEVPHQVNTPGSLIQGQLETTFGTELGSLITADEFNELMGALASLVISNIFSKGSDGLRTVDMASFEGYIDGMNRTAEEIEAEGDQIVDDAVARNQDQITDPDGARDTFDDATDDANGISDGIRDDAQQQFCQNNPTDPSCQPTTGPGPDPGDDLPPPPPPTGLPDVPSPGGLGQVPPPPPDPEDTPPDDGGNET